MSWTEDRIEKLKRLWADPAQTGDSIADVLGVSRSAVLAKLFRLGLKKPISAAPVADDRFERLVDLVADEVETLRGAAHAVGMPVSAAVEQWRAMCSRGGHQYDFDWFRGDVVTPERPQ